MTYFIRLIEIVAVVGCISSSLYYLFCLWSAAAFVRARNAGIACPEPAEGSARATQALPPVSMLKPLKGIDPDIYESFRSHCLQEYPEYEIIFGVSDAEDPAVASVRHLQQEFPQRAIQLVVCSEELGTNVKVSNLEQMLKAARYEHLIVNDSDIRVDAAYLRHVVEPLSKPEVGMVTCLYRGIPVPTLGSRLESLGISTDFCPGVLVVCELEGGLRFALGSTLAFRRADLQRIGGFHSIVDFLADDYELGKRIAGLGLQVLLSDVVVETHLPAYDLAGFLAHQIRWGRGVRDARKGGYFGLISTFGLIWALLAVIAADGAPWAWMIFAAVLILRFAVAVVVGNGVLSDRNVLRYLWLLPLRDLIAFGVWVVSFFGHTVTWRGDRFQLKDGKLIPIR